MKVLLALLMGFSFLFATVDINTASKSELMSLKGIGSKKAEAIINYRTTTCFKNIKALIDVKGIGPKFLEKNEKNLEASKCKK